MRVSRTASSLSIEGIVASDERRLAITSALATSAQPPWVTLRIRVAGKHPSDSKAAVAETLRAGEVLGRDDAPPPIEPALRAYFSRIQPAGQEPAKSAAAFSTSVLAQSSEAVRETWALRRLAEDYDPRVLGPQNREAFASMSQDHLAAISSEFHAAARSLEPLFPVGAPGSEGLPTDSASWRDSVLSLFESVSRFESYASYLFGGDASALAGHTPDRPGRLELLSADQGLHALAVSVPEIEARLQAARRMLAAAGQPR